MRAFPAALLFATAFPVAAALLFPAALPFATALPFGEGLPGKPLSLVKSAR